MSLPPTDERPQEGGTPAQSASELGPGSVLGGKYRITKKLGEGGMGVVFAGVHEKLGRGVAIKILRHDLCNSQEQLQRFQREAELVTKIGHPNIVAVYDFGRIADGSLYYVMEVLKGESVRDRLTRGPLGDTELAIVFAQLLSALKAAHDLGAVHRDLKPDNVFLVQGDPDEPPTVKLLDFGVAKIRNPQNTEAPAAPEEGSDVEAALASKGKDQLATAAGAIMGTPAYMAPEQIKGAGKVDQRADIYALGIMLFEAIVGKRPFTGQSFGELLAQHLFEEAPAPSVVHLELKLRDRGVNWDRLDALVKRTLAKSPDERYPDCGSLLADLEEVFGKQRFAGMNALPDLTQMEAAHSAANQAERRRILKRKITLGSVALLLLIGSAVAVQRLTAGPQVKRIDLTKARQQAAKIIMARRSDPNSLPDLMTTIALSHSRDLLPLVEDGLGSERSEVWRAAVQAALRLCQPTDQDLRGQLLSASDAAVGAAAVDVAVARQRCGDPAAKTALIALGSAPALDDSSRLRAVLALAAAGHVPATSLRSALGVALRHGAVPTDLRRDVLVQLIVMKDPEALRQVNEAAAKNPAPGETDVRQQRLEALQALALSHQPRAGDLLYSAASKAGGDEHVELVMALAEAGDSWAPKLLTPLLKDPNPKLRARAAAGLGWVANQLKDPAHQEERLRMAGAIEPLMADKDPQVALTAAVMLADADTVAASTPPNSPGPDPANSKAQEGEAP